MTDEKKDININLNNSQSVDIDNYRKQLEIENAYYCAQYNHGLKVGIVVCVVLAIIIFGIPFLLINYVFADSVVSPFHDYLFSSTNFLAFLGSALIY